MAKLLTSKEIQHKLIKFNETNDWSLFDGVDESQQICFMYPHIMDLEAYKKMVNYIPEDMETQKTS